MSSLYISYEADVTLFKHDKVSDEPSGTNNILEALAYFKCLFLKNYGGKKL